MNQGVHRSHANFSNPWRSGFYPPSQGPIGCPPGDNPVRSRLLLLIPARRKVRHTREQIVRFKFTLDEEQGRHGSKLKGTFAMSNSYSRPSQGQQDTTSEVPHDTPAPSRAACDSFCHAPPPHPTPPTPPPSSITDTVFDTGHPHRRPDSLLSSEHGSSTSAPSRRSGSSSASTTTATSTCTSTSTSATSSTSSLRPAYKDVHKHKHRDRAPSHASSSPEPNTKEEKGDSRRKEKSASRMSQSTSRFSGTTSTVIKKRGTHTNQMVVVKTQDVKRKMSSESKTIKEVRTKKAQGFFKHVVEYS
ncbi:hypothetical protein DL98DRAFT_571126 [Cadophora sp. DSE1049]|nr:hypothetical protein DL98DRAFT_571126 [Cadophora sp. DSE1049]